MQLAMQPSSILIALARTQGLNLIFTSLLKNIQFSPILFLAYQGLFFQIPMPKVKFTYLKHQYHPWY